MTSFGLTDKGSLFCTYPVMYVCVCYVCKQVVTSSTRRWVQKLSVLAIYRMFHDFRA